MFPYVEQCDSAACTHEEKMNLVAVLSLNIDIYIVEGAINESHLQVVQIGYVVNFSSKLGDTIPASGCKGNRSDLSLLK